jgi:hypothetical protein
MSKCPKCHTDGALILFSSVECRRKGCPNYVAPIGPTEKKSTACQNLMCSCHGDRAFWASLNDREWCALFGPTGTDRLKFWHLQPINRYWSSRD